MVNRRIREKQMKRGSNMERPLSEISKEIRETNKKIYDLSDLAYMQTNDEDKSLTKKTEKEIKKMEEKLTKLKEELNGEKMVDICPACEGDPYARHNHDTFDDLYPPRPTGF